MLITIRNEEQLSAKARFIVQLLSEFKIGRVFYAYKRESNLFSEKWQSDKVELSSSTKGTVLYYGLTLLKSPQDSLKGLMFRLSLIKPNYTLTGQGFLSILAQVLLLRFGTSARSERFYKFLKKENGTNIIIIDEFVSLRCLDLKQLRQFGRIIYVSQDTAYNRFGFGDNPLTRRLMYRLESDELVNVDLVVACSEMERLKYLQMGAKKTIYYPNFYPTTTFKPYNKDETPSICIVLREHWGVKAEMSLSEIFEALAFLKKPIKVYLIGIKPSKVPKTVSLKHYSFIKAKLDYLRILSNSWLGINIGIHLAGTNERKYDYAEAGTVVISDQIGSRGDLLPHEYTYVDSHDLAAKIEQLLDLGKLDLVEKGRENRKYILSLTSKQRKTVLDNILCSS
jgi:glycosyltransferase involved in cell wall biosynthesis